MESWEEDPVSGRNTFIAADGATVTILFGDYYTHSCWHVAWVEKDARTKDVQYVQIDGPPIPLVTDRE